MDTLMETKHTAVSYKAADIKQEVIKAVLHTSGWAKDNNKRLEVNGIETAIDMAGLATTFGKNIEGAISLASKKTKKKLLGKIKSLKGTLTLRKVNVFYHFLRTKVLVDQNLPSYKFIVSEKEQDIMQARKTWVTLRDAAAKALIIYKATKGDFYKENRKD